MLLQREIKKVYLGSTQVRPAVPITTAWIYHNADLWLISLSSDWTTRTTIADKNLWASQVYDWTSNVTQANGGNYFQRWNNYKFNWYDWANPTTSTLQITNASTYWPWNYYSDSVFRTITYSPYDWASPKNDNLRWWTTGTAAAMKWPCPDGFHIPSSTELTNLINIWISLWAWTASNGTWMINYLKFPATWYRAYNSWSVTGNANTKLFRVRSSSVSGTNWMYLVWATNVATVYSNGYRSMGYVIRPFKNEAVQPDSDWTVIYQ